ncbi:HET-domain-containing protein [Xylaria venustula]|nr:HET-domain-containing protein [Xylaria venustula]
MQYQYTSLGDSEIRLIELRPACDGPELSVSFNCLSVDEATNTYEALSYTWGDSTESYVLLCGDTRLKITTSLQSALASLRLDSGPRVLWVDAICINQDDLLERGKQVRLMEKIYRSASKTVVYLGDEGADSALAAKYLENHMSRFKQALVDSINQRRIAEDASQMAVICMRSLGESQAKLFEGFNQIAVQEALVNLLCRPWFRRIWVIQEFVVSPTVDMYCGKTMCEWGSLPIIFNWSFVEAGVSWDHIAPRQKRIDFFRAVTQMAQMHELRRNFHDKNGDGSKNDNLVKLLSSCRTADATLPIDKVYALLNMSSAAHKPTPNYLMSKTDVYRQFAEFALKNGHSAAILSEAAITNRVDPDLPSWVPDWTEVPTRLNLSQMLTASEGHVFFKANYSQNQDQWYSKSSPHVQGHTLSLKGAAFQTITLVCPSQRTAGVNADDAPNLTHLISILAHIGVFIKMEYEYPTGEEKAVVAGILLEANQRHSEYNVTSIWENTLSRDLLFEPELPALSPGADIVGEAMWRRRLHDPKGFANMCRAVAGRLLAFTDQGYAGLVPDTAKDGDKICILQGFNVPYVLRQVGEHYTLIGDAYVHGIMFGEAFQRDETLSESMVEMAIR